MKRPQLGLFAVAFAILVVGLVWAGVPASTLLIAGLVLVCPLMMLVMMRGMHGHESVHDNRPAPPAGESHGDWGHQTAHRSTR
jgi:cell division protein FtsW (lipid II flippase)